MKNLNNTQKSGQVTIFVIIGVILIIVVTFLLSNSKFELFESKETKLINQVSDIVDACIKTNSEQGLFLLGMQAGYVTLEPSQIAVPRSYIDLGFKVPSWEVAPNEVPTINSMEYELDQFIQDNAMNCISGNLNALNDIFDFEYKNNLQVNSKINQNNVVVESNLPITFSEKNSEEKVNIESYYLKLDDNNLGDLYNLAIEVYSTEQKNDILSNLVLDQIYSASDYSSKESMPTEGLSFSCAKRIWTKQQLKSNLVNLNNNNFKFLHFEDTYSIQDLYDSTFNDIQVSSDAAQYYENFYTFKLDDPKSSFKNYKVEVSMPTTDVTKKGNYFQKDRFRNFEVTPNDGEVIQSTDMKVDIGLGEIPIPCVQLFHHLYTLDYDVLVKITDLSEDGDNNIFQFPLRIQINNNAPSNEIPFTLPTETDNQLTATNSKFCAHQNRNTEQLIYAIDKNTQEAIDGVNITYKCLSLSCDVGKTSKPFYRGFERTYAQSSLNTDLPYCVGGTLSGEKKGYFSTKLIIDSSGDNPNPNGYEDLIMIPTKSFKLNEDTVFAVFNGGSGKRIETEDDGMMFISIKNKEHGFSSQALWPTQEGIMDELEFLELDDAVYDVSVILTNENYNLNGIFEIKDWKPEIFRGNTLQIIIPAITEELEDEQFISFYETSNKLVTGEIDLGIEYGIKFQ